MVNVIWMQLIRPVILSEVMLNEYNIMVFRDVCLCTSEMYLKCQYSEMLLL